MTHTSKWMLYLISGTCLIILLGITHNRVFYPCGSWKYTKYYKVLNNTGTSKASTILTSLLKSVLEPRAILDVVNANCSHICHSQYDPHRGYPKLMFHGRFPELVTADMFRDMSDFVVTWVSWIDPQAPNVQNYSNIPSNLNVLPVLKCLGPVPIIYTRGSPEYVRHFIRDVLPFLTSPFILITGNSDHDVPHISATSLLSDRRLIHWYTQNPNYNHPKFSPLPIGISYYQGIPLRKIHPTFVSVNELRQNAKAALQSYHNGTLTKLLALRFSFSYPQRRLLHKHYCGLPFADCSNFERRNKTSLNITSNYIHLNNIPFWLSPRGNGLDCFRTYEALYLGRIPIVESSFLDPLYTDLPVIIMKNLMEITEEFLVSELEAVSTKTFDLSKLHVSHWWKVIEDKRASFIARSRLKEQDFPTRVQCWGEGST